MVMGMHTACEALPAPCAAAAATWMMAPRAASMMPKECYPSSRRNSGTLSTAVLPFSRAVLPTCMGIWLGVTPAFSTVL